MQLPALAGVIFPLRLCGKEPRGSTSTVRVTCSHKLFLCQRRRRAVRVVMGNAIVLTISPKMKIVFWSHYRKGIGPGILRPFQENKLLLGKMRELCGWLTLLLSGIDPVCQKDADAWNAKSVFFFCFFYPWLCTGWGDQRILQFMWQKMVMKVLGKEGERRTKSLLTLFFSQESNFAPFQH